VRFANSKILAAAAALVFAIGALSMIGCFKKPAPKPLPDKPGMPGAILAPPRLIIGYYENPWKGTSDKTGSFPSMKAFGNNLTAVAPFWYRATEDGTLEGADSQLVYDTARQMGLRVYPLITNKSGATDAVLGDAGIRSKVVDNIVKVVQEKGYDGVNIDFELLPKKYRDELTAFMAELYPKLNAMGKTVIISVFPQVDVTEDIAGAYNYPELAKNADYLQIMTYDHHWESSPPGPLAPIDWYEKNIKNAIDQVGNKNKIIVGVGLYGYDWQKGNGAETVTYVDAIVRAEQNGAKISYDEDAQAPHYKYDGHEVWFENEHSTSAKLDVINKYDPAGIAFWRLGQEQPEVWATVQKKYPKQR